MEDEWSTDDMSLAAVLVLNGNNYEAIEWDGDTCYFYFPRTLELLGTVQRYTGSLERVEPKRYNQTFGRLKREAFNHPDAVRRRPAPAR